VRNISVLVAIGVGTDGFRQVLGAAEGEKEGLEGWRGFRLNALFERSGAARVSSVHFPDGHSALSGSFAFHGPTDWAGEGAVALLRVLNLQ
jgi:transposase-like protein